MATTSSDGSPREIGVSISIRTILLAAIVVAVGASIASIRSVLLVIFVSGFGVAILSPLATGMERRLGWSRRVQIVVEELTACRRARIAAADAAERTQ